jgi:hypothetical protein
MMLFEWDDAKAEANLKKHGVSFPDATLVFDDPGLQVDGEQRWQATGSARGEAVLLVVHTVIGNDEDERIRIISARRATRREIRRYQGTLS